ERLIRKDATRHFASLLIRTECSCARCSSFNAAINRFTPNSDIDCVVRHVWFGPQADITSSIRSLLGAQRWQSMASEHHDSSSASPSDHLSLDYRQSEQQDYPERTGIWL